MPNRIKQWNRNSSKWLSIILVVGIIATLPFVYSRIQTERSAKQVELVFNYSGLLEIANIKPDSQAYLQEQLMKLKQSGVHSLAIGDSTLNSLQASKRLMLYTPQEVMGLQSALPPTSLSMNRTYFLFHDEKAERQLSPMIQAYFKQLNVTVEQWSHRNQNGFVIDMPQSETVLISMEPDPIAIKELHEQGFGLILMASNRIQPSTVAAISERWSRLASQPGVHSVMIDGDSVPGYHILEDDSSIQAFASILKKNRIPLAYMEMQKTNPFDMDKLAKYMDGNVLRLHHLSAPETIKLADAMTKEQLDQRIQRYQDRLSLAVKDRNIRMILISAKPAVSSSTGKYTEPMEQLHQILSNNDGVIERVQEAGYSFGTAVPFNDHTVKLANYLVVLVALGAIALIASTIACYLPDTRLIVFILGLIGTAGLAYLSPTIAAKLLALGVSICVPTLTMIMAIQWIRGITKRKIKTSPWFSYILFFGSCVLTIFGSLLIVSLLHGLNYYLLLDQFVGVRVASIAPILLVAIYVLFYLEELTFEQQTAKVIRLLTTPITVLWVMCAAFALIVLLYYVSRTGNSGYASPLELMFRSVLENTFGVRPRNKEILLAHPIFILGAYLAIQRKTVGWYFIALGVIGQASILGTFNHLHTPLQITVIRIILGAVIGAVVGTAYIAVWSVLERVWERIVPPAIKNIFKSDHSISRT